MKKVTTLDDFLVRDYLIKILGEGEEFVQNFYKDLLAKSLLFQKLLAREKLPSLTEEELKEVLEKVFSVRRKKEKLLEETGVEKLKKAIADLLYGKADSWEERVEKFVKEIRGVDRRAARDLASELLHFTFPEEYVLWTSWIWDPESESGAVVFLKEEPPKRHMYGETYEEFQQIYRQIQEKLQDFGIKVRGYLFVDIFLAMIYATYVDYMTLSTMHSAKGFFPPAGVMARRLLGVQRKDEIMEVGS
ncbi:conserved hypothetical protein [Thermocrinis albus DSM 14484]|uniref:Uncharacterized protein n=1 Tax=Thermocrinis albus (strain DSM 14484 / JCM 11386 / HI 11/12) TaxID=638303 RepID=D3SMJ6_THEAH|nr:hypothetical protein [Thermocrinis albus]ADC89976.1 conserved hypothetical protein [Thermocrinis albus DSM 14484]